MKKIFGLSAVLATLAVVGWTVTVAMAAPLANPQEAANCSTATGTWHFVHVQTSATSGTLTATIGGTTYNVLNSPSASKNLHYNITAGGTLAAGAHDDVVGGKLVLSDCPTAVPPPSDPPPSDPPPADPPPAP
jgi:hypothetical protein